MLKPKVNDWLFKKWGFNYVVIFLDPKTCSKIFDGGKCRSEIQSNNLAIGTQWQNSLWTISSFFMFFLYSIMLLFKFMFQQNNKFLIYEPTITILFINILLTAYAVSIQIICRAFETNYYFTYYLQTSLTGLYWLVKCNLIALPVCKN